MRLSTLTHIIGLFLLITVSAVLATTVALPTVAASFTEATETYSFDQFIIKYNKNYQNEEEYNRRRLIFNSNLAEVIAFNNLSNTSYKMGLNRFSDLTREEFSEKFNGRITTSQSRTTQLNMNYYKLNNIKVPESMTWQDSKNPILTPIKDQGNCGSCWAHAATECVESMYALQYGKLFTLSTQQVTSCTENKNHCGGTGGCSGGTAQLGWEYIKNAGGITFNEDYPYKSGNTSNTEQCVLNDSMPKDVKVYGYVNLPHNNYDAVVEALVTKGPLAISVDASDWSLYAGGIFDNCGKDGKNITINHAVQLVGYGTDKVTKQDYWIVRNSWGDSWGEKGYIRLLRNKNQDICVYVNNWNSIGGGCEDDSNVTITACGMCGLLYDVSYPNVLNEPEKKKLVWIAGAAFGGLGVLMIALVIYSKCCRSRKVSEATLLAEADLIE